MGRQRYAAATGLAGLLDEAERDRLTRLRRREDRERFTAGAVLLRLVAAAYLDQAVGQVQVQRRCPRCGEPHGKPIVTAPGACAGSLEASVSHAAEVVVVAVTLAAPVGVDVEPVDPNLPVDELASLCLAPTEAAALAGLATADRPRAFLTCWTRKEAVLKALGVGLTVPPSQVLAPYPGMSVRAPVPVPIPGYVAALAVVGGLRRIRHFDATRDGTPEGDGVARPARTGGLPP